MALEPFSGFVHSAELLEQGSRNFVRRFESLVEFGEYKIVSILTVLHGVERSDAWHETLSVAGSRLKKRASSKPRGASHFDLLANEAHCR